MMGSICSGSLYLVPWKLMGKEFGSQYLYECSVTIPFSEQSARPIELCYAPAALTLVYRPISKCNCLSDGMK